MKIDSKKAGREAFHQVRHNFRNIENYSSRNIIKKKTKVKVETKTKIKPPKPPKIEKIKAPKQKRKNEVNIDERSKKPKK